MSDWTEQANCLAAIQAGYEDADWINNSVLTPAYNTAYDRWSDNNDHASISYILNYLYWNMELHNELLKEHDTESYKFALPYYLEKYAGGDVTMEKILDAMWESDKLRNFHFINWIDAMRAGIWNTEIKESHLVDWYEHFS